MEKSKPNMISQAPQSHATLGAGALEASQSGARFSMVLYH